MTTFAEELTDVDTSKYVLNLAEPSTSKLALASSLPIATPPPVLTLITLSPTSISFAIKVLVLISPEDGSLRLKSVEVNIPVIFTDDVNTLGPSNFELLDTNKSLVPALGVPT